tara:strand:+ start:10552 stop:11058 length:507 start_codon:yes stop_codon:yes gene_type:complete
MENYDSDNDSYDYEELKLQDPEAYRQIMELENNEKKNKYEEECLNNEKGELTDFFENIFGGFQNNNKDNETTNFTSKKNDPEELLKLLFAINQTFDFDEKYIKNDIPSKKIVDTTENVMLIDITDINTIKIPDFTSTEKKYKRIMKRNERLKDRYKMLISQKCNKNIF